LPEKRCVWSHRHDPGTRPITLRPGERYAEETVWVCPAHEEQFRRFYAYAARYGSTFIALIGLIVLAGFGLVLFESSVGLGLLLMGIGAVMLVFPFATPQTVQMLGVRTSVWLVRLGGLLMIGFGLYELVRAAGPA
jgi:hypothetical protein